MAKIRKIRPLILLLFLVSPIASWAGGYFWWDSTITNSAQQTLLPAGSLNSTDPGSGVSIRGAAKNLTANTAVHFSTSKVTYGSGGSFVLTGTDITLQLQTDGSVTIQRTAGTDSWNVLIRVIWM